MNICNRNFSLTLPRMIEVLAFVLVFAQKVLSVTVVLYFVHGYHGPIGHWKQSLIDY